MLLFRLHWFLLVSMGVFSRRRGLGRHWYLSSASLRHGHGQHPSMRRVEQAVAVGVDFYLCTHLLIIIFHVEV